MIVRFTYGETHVNIPIAWDAFTLDGYLFIRGDDGRFTNVGRAR